MQKVRLKFHCHQKTQQVGTRYRQPTEEEPGGYVQCLTGGVRLSAVTNNDPGEDSKAFYEATPTGNLEFQTINEEASAMFEPGASYYITIEKA